ncbi:TetR/AcrR family transcriptional regulator [Aquihabitans sp. McL0605]|uniref:TetR/AcrR family transcriptional regulator n=1 Tax=Aquihabitans sp. McL0605 TaxID=3415671 RepID=UPI003CF4F2D1
MTSVPALRLVDTDAPAAGSEATERILDAALVLVARWGVSKTALADVAKEAGCSRATLYRAFPGGKQHLFHALAARELQTYLGAILDAIDAADELADALTRAMVVAARLVRDHDGAQFILEHEPELFLPFLGFRQVDLVYRHTAGAVGPHLERFLPADRAAWAAEWGARLFITYLFNPQADLDLAVIGDARGLVDRFLIPAFAAQIVPTRPST